VGLSRTIFCCQNDQIKTLVFSSGPSSLTLIFVWWSSWSEDHQLAVRLFSIFVADMEMQYSAREMTLLGLDP
jgi:hypothetical protein